ncbi:hypothetical protein DB400_22480 [Salmonella enterica]|nr:hypothetical protein [Salmonella enterica]ECP6864465.1 hypothetical protein [Salmonella enterica]EDB4340191.1 hypothetical protein [Salmonella enterica]EDQ3688786.1 hypothetical protein [Salmonella enterica subsp. enterica serovar Bonariensis]EDV5058796.1 hypothetical protein [Salmonella enterica subsp. enterica]
MNSRLFTFVIFARSGCDRSGDARGDKKVFSGFTVHTVHLWFFINNFMVIQGEYTVKGEQWIVHPVAMSRKKKTGCCRSE